MSYENSCSKILFDSIRGRFLRNREFGCSMFGFAGLGEDQFCVKNVKGETVELSGIYQTRRNNGRQFYSLLRYMIPYNPQSGTQQANRQKYADSIVAWRNLTSEQKKVYNKLALGKKMSGYNFFQREYMLSH